MTDTSDPSRHAASKRTELDVLIELGYSLALFVFLLKIVTGPHLNFSFSNATFRTSGINIFLCFLLNYWPKKSYKHHEVRKNKARRQASDLAGIAGSYLPHSSSRYPGLLEWTKISVRLDLSPRRLPSEFTVATIDSMN